MPTEDTDIITTLRAFDKNDEKDYRSFRPKSQRDEVEKSIQTRFLDSAFGSARNDVEGVRKMTEPNSKPEKPKDERRYDPELLKKGLRCDLDQYEMLKRCSDKKDMTEWNEWRKKNPEKDVFLEGANLSGMYLDRVLLNSGGIKNNKTGEYEKFNGEVHLENANFRNASIKQTNLWGALMQSAHIADAHLEGADLCYAQLNDAYLNKAHLEDTLLLDANLKGAKLCLSYLERAMMMGTHLEGAVLTGANLKDAHLENAHLEGAYLNDTDMQRAEVRNAHLEGAKLQEASLKSTNFMGAFVDGNTSMWKVKVNQFRVSTAKDWLFTDFSGVPLQSVIIDPATKQLIEYNIRRKYWYKWMTEKNWNEVFSDEKKPIKRKFLDKSVHSFVHLFFWISDYGLRTWRIIGTILGFALFFAIIYYVWGAVDYYYFDVKCNPGIVSHLFVDDENTRVPYWLVPVRALYFSVVTMTTLGFGDIHANAQRLWGHLLLTLQVIWGYVLLGALVTRFAVLFTAGGPSGRFEDDQHAKTVA